MSYRGTTVWHIAFIFAGMLGACTVFWFLKSPAVAMWVGGIWTFLLAVHSWLWWLEMRDERRLDEMAEWLTQPSQAHARRQSSLPNRSRRRPAAR